MAENVTAPAIQKSTNTNLGVAFWQIIATDSASLNDATNEDTIIVADTIYLQIYRGVKYRGLVVDEDIPLYSATINVISPMTANEIGSRDLSTKQDRDFTSTVGESE